MVSNVKVKWSGQMIDSKKVLEYIKMWNEVSIEAQRELRNMQTEPDSLEKGKKFDYWTKQNNVAKQALGRLRQLWNENYAGKVNPPN